MTNQSYKSGFTTVELLVSLFIASMFMMTGFELYGIIMKDGSSTRNQAKAANIASEFMYNAQSTVTATCTARTSNPSPPSNTGLSALEVTITTSCPYGTTASLSKLKVDVKYGNTSPKQQVSTVVYATAN